MTETIGGNWYDDVRITEAQLDAIRADLGDNGRAQFSRAVMRKIMAEVERLRGHLNAIADAHQDGVMARRQLDAIHTQEVAALKTRAETAERELAELRAKHQPGPNLHAWRRPDGYCVHGDEEWIRGSVKRYGGTFETAETCRYQGEWKPVDE